MYHYKISTEGSAKLLWAGCRARSAPFCRLISLKRGGAKCTCAQVRPKPINYIEGYSKFSWLPPYFTIPLRFLKHSSNPYSSSTGKHINISKWSVVWPVIGSKGRQEAEALMNKYGGIGLCIFLCGSIYNLCPIQFAQ